jgi:hypothetical protein
MTHIHSIDISLTHYIRLGEYFTNLGGEFRPAAAAAAAVRHRRGGERSGCGGCACRREWVWCARCAQRAAATCDGLYARGAGIEGAGWYVRPAVAGGGGGDVSGV